MEAECVAVRPRGLSAASGSHSPRPGYSGVTNNPLRKPSHGGDRLVRSATPIYGRGDGHVSRLAPTYVILEMNGGGALARSRLGAGLARGRGAGVNPVHLRVPPR